MKKIDWTEIAIAAPTTLVFANLGGIQTMLIVSALLAIFIVTVKLHTAKKPSVMPIKMKSRGFLN
ncbi:MAG TPA: hypothetical protein VG737_06960 [Cyclobacteriaceae bacterium]|nr:hypothetical protein [Cyclobacteriaceae bacterium]